MPEEKSTAEEARDLTNEYVCIKCGCTGFVGDDMHELVLFEDRRRRDPVIAAWVHRECLGQYMVAGSKLWGALASSKLRERDSRKRKGE